MHGQSLGLKFEDIVGQYPKNVALRYSSDKFITYADLNQKANQIARFLIGNGIGKNDVVCITSLKGINTYASILACLKIGAIYSIVDRDSPLERLKKILGNCSPKLLLIDDDFLLRLSQSNNPFKAVSISNAEFKNSIQSYDSNNLTETQGILGDNPAYIMYTS